MRSQLCAIAFAASLTVVGCSSSRNAPPPSSALARDTAPAPAPDRAAPPAPTPYAAPPVSAPPLSDAPPPARAAAPAPPDTVVVPAPAPPPVAAVPEQPVAATSPASRPYMDILKLKQAGLSDDFLLNKIRTQTANYQLTTTEILELRSVGISENVLAAMMRSGQTGSATAGTPIVRRAEFSGLARVGKGFLGVFGTSTKNVGRLVVDGDQISWYESEDPKRNFSVYAKNVKEIFDTCVLRPGQNLCLEFGLVTYTGEEYRFREPGWKNGDNRSVTEATEYFRQAFPNLFFSQRAVNEI